jgi:phosphate transport system substrate-binding protein
MASPAPSLGAELVRVNGSGTALEVAHVLARAFEAAHGAQSCRIEPPLGSSGAVRALLAGAIEVAVISRPLEASEIAKGAHARSFGKTPLVIVTHPGVRKTDVTVAELEGIIAGRVTKWPDGERIRVILRPEQETNTKLLNALSPGMELADAVARKKPWAIIAVTDPETNQMLVQTPGAIGASTLVSIVVGKLPLNRLTLAGVEATVPAIANGSYPLAKPIVFVTTDRTSAAGHAFVDLAFATQGRRLAQEAGVLVTAPDSGR